MARRGVDTRGPPPASRPRRPRRDAEVRLHRRAQRAGAGERAGDGGAFDYEHELARLSILGAKDNPALQYIGVSRGGEYAIFLLAPGAIAAGDDGACIIADSCRAIGLRKGDKLEVQVARTGTGPLHYKLELTSLRRVARTTKAAAQRDRSRVASGGREALHGLSKDLPTAAALGQLRYGPASGTVALVRAP